MLSMPRPLNAARLRISRFRPSRAEARRSRPCGQGLVHLVQHAPRVEGDLIAHDGAQPLRRVQRRAQRARGGLVLHEGHDAALAQRAAAVSVAQDERGLHLGLHGEGFGQRRRARATPPTCRRGGRGSRAGAARCPRRARRSGRARRDCRRRGSKARVPPRVSSIGAPAGRSSVTGLTGPSESTQVSLLPPPRCMETTRESRELATRVRPPGIAWYSPSSLAVR